MLRLSRWLSRRIDIFTRKRFKEILIDSLRYCIEKKELVVYGWVLMSNHIHLIVRSNKGDLSGTIRDFKKYTSGIILQSIREEPESRRNWMLWIFSKASKENSNNVKYQFWQQDNHPIYLLSNEVMQQKLDYIHMNPVRAGIVEEPCHYQYSSAKDYIGEQGLLKIKLIE